MYQKFTMKVNVDYGCKPVPFVHSVMTCDCEAYAKTNYLGRHIILSFLQMQNYGHHCEQLLMFTLLWLVVIRHTIFQMRPVFFWYISNEIKD